MRVRGMHDIVDFGAGTVQHRAGKVLFGPGPSQDYADYDGLYPRKLLTAVYPPKLAPFGLKLCEDAFHGISEF